MPLLKKCKFCNTEFSARSEKYNFCSHSCGTRHQWKTNQIRHFDKKEFEVLCRNCKNVFHVPLYLSKRTRFCSRKCAHIAQKNNAFGFQPQNNPPVKYKDMFTINGRHIREHRFIMENHLGRELNSWEHVHHIDGNGLNNELSNLVVLTNREHQKIHKRTIKSTE